jgi:excinuclease ABC subunit B
MSKDFKLSQAMQPKGDQPVAIKTILDGFKSGKQHQTLLGVTGSGKTFTMANVIQKMGKKTLILAHNKTLAAQLFAEFKEFFPENAVEYFVSYYDYYQPEAYIPGTDTFIEKDSAINDEIDKLRHSATRSLLEREDVIVIASVSCIYGIGSPDEYSAQKIKLSTGMSFVREEFLRNLVSVQYERNDMDFHRGTFRVRGDMVEIFPAYEDSNVIRLEFFDDELDTISIVDPLRGRVIEKLNSVTIYPSSHYVVSTEKMKAAIQGIKEELRERIQYFEKEGKLLEKQRITQRTMFDLEMLEEMGFCQGIENYSRHMTGSKPGEPPPTLIDFFFKDFLIIVDESHITIPQIGGMYRGDRARKETLVNFGFRLPSALDNRPLNFQEFEQKLDQVLYVSATPGKYELEQTQGEFAEQIIRPTGLVDPIIEVRDAKFQVDDFLTEAKKTIKDGFRVLVTTLTKRLAEELTTFYRSVGMRVRYLHSDITTIERMEILRDLRLGEFDILVGINLLREGLDLPEVALVGILDADKEGFLRSDRSLIQTIGRAARNDQGRVVMYAYKTTPSMERAISETNRRRQIQISFNQKNGIIPQTIQKKITGGVIDILRSTKGKGKGKAKMKDVAFDAENLDKRVQELKVEMQRAVKELRFEDAAKIRDEIKSLNEARIML